MYCFFAHARSSGVDKLKLCNKPSDLSSQSVWLNYLFTEWVLCAELRWMYYDQDIIITEDSVLMPDRVLEKNASPFMDWMAVGFFHLLALGGQTLAGEKTFALFVCFFLFCVLCVLRW